MSHGPIRARRVVALSAGLVVAVTMAAAPSLSAAASSRPQATSASGATPRVAPRTCPAGQSTAFGAPRWEICNIGGQYLTSPAVGTIDGQKVVVDGSESGVVNVVNARTGQEMPGWPQRADLVGGTATAIDSSPAIAYLDGPNAEPSIVVGLGTLEEKCQNGGVMAWNYNGTVRFRFLTKKTFTEWASGCPSTYTNGVFASPAIGDITGKGQQDIVFGSWDHYVYALNRYGKLVPGFPINRADTIWSSPALVDTTHSGKMDIIEGGDASGWRGPYGGSPCYSGWISDYRYANGLPTLKWEHCLAETVWSSPAVTMFGSTPVVVVGTSYFYGAGRHTQPAEDEVFAYNAVNGDLMPGWPVNTAGATFGSPAVGPAYPGGPTEVFQSSCAVCPKTGDSIVTAWSQSGHRLWVHDITTYGELLSSPTLASVANFSTRGLSDNEILIGNVNGLYILDARTGNPVAGTNSEPINQSCYVGGAPAVAAVPGSTTGYMMFTNCGYHPGMTVPTYLRGYDVPAPTNPYPWPMFRGNPQRTGVADPFSTTRRACSTPQSPSGYRVFGVAGAVAGFGAAGDCGDLATQILPEDVAGMASTPNGGGYWLALKDGAVYAFGDARDYGDLRSGSWKGGPAAPGAPVMGISSSPDGKGYFLLAGDGSVYAFGDAKYHGSRGDYHVAGIPIAIATDDATGGYWIATDSGGVYNFDAPFLGSQRNGHTSPMVGFAASKGDNGYWLVTRSGYVFRFGQAGSYGSSPHNTIVNMAAAVGGKGYYLVTTTGAILRHGTAPNAGTRANLGGQPVAGISTP